MHRPISVTAPVPPASSIDTFNSIFDTKIDKFSDVMVTLSDAVESLEAAGQFREEGDARDSIFNNQGANAQMGGQLTAADLEQLLMQCVPFRPPPPPVPHKDAASKRKASNRKQALTQQAPTHKSWSVNVNVTESTFSDGRRRLTIAASEPQEMEVDEATSTEVPSESKRVAHQPFLQRMYARHLVNAAKIRRVQGNSSRGMLLISVKRQRKLKMKKHKYKKLMKRTRTLRRKLERS